MMRHGVRWTLVIFIFLILSGSVWYAWDRWLHQSVVLKVGVQSLEGDDAQLLQQIDHWLQTNNRRYRIKLVPADLKLSETLMDKGEIQMLSMRADQYHHPAYSSVAVLYREAAILAVDNHSKIERWADLKGKAILVIGHTDLEDPLVHALLNMHGAVEPKLMQVPQAQVGALWRQHKIDGTVYVAPLSGGFVRELRQIKFGRNHPTLSIIGVDDAEALAARDRRYEDIEIPAGGLRVAPALPEEAINTLGVARHLVAPNSTAAPKIVLFLRDLMDARRGIQNENPLSARIGAPSLEPDAAIPVHAASASYFGNDASGLLDRVLGLAYFIPIMLGAVGTALVWVFHFLRPKPNDGARLMGELIQIRQDLLQPRTPENLAAYTERLQALHTTLYKLAQQKNANEHEMLSILIALDGVEQRLRTQRAEAHAMPASPAPAPQG